MSREKSWLTKNKPGGLIIKDAKPHSIIPKSPSIIDTTKFSGVNKGCEKSTEWTEGGALMEKLFAGNFREML